MSSQTECKLENFICTLFRKKKIELPMSKIISKVHIRYDQQIYTRNAPKIIHKLVDDRVLIIGESKGMEVFKRKK